MERSKQTALMFLLGAVLVGGVLGFTADRVFQDKSGHWARRTRMYNDLGLSEAQRSAMDSLLDARNCQMTVVMQPVQPQLDSIRKAAHEQVLSILTPGQRQKLELRAAEQRRREASGRPRRDSARGATKTTTTCK